MRDHVAITGLGAVTGYGPGHEVFWDGLVAGRSAIGPITDFDPSGFLCRYWSKAQGLAVRDHVPKSYRKSIKVMARDAELAVVAAKLAVEDARLVTRGNSEDPEAGPTYPPERLGCSIGAGLIAAETDEISAALATATDDQGRFSLKKWGTIGEENGGGMANLPPLWLLKYLPNMLACHVTIIHGATGPSNTITCSEASALLSIGESMRIIERGQADACFAGGAESKLNLMGLLRMSLTGLVANTQGIEDGGEIVRPYDPQSPGSILGEGAGILVLEKASSAHARGARVYASLLGFGAAQSLSSDKEGEGLAGAIRSALRDSGTEHDRIDAIVPRASGSPDADAKEAAALRAVFGTRLLHIPLITLTPNIGETSAARGALQVAAAARAIHAQALPARLHAGRPESSVMAGRADSIQKPLSRVLVCTGSLGGQNAAAVLGPPA